MIRVLLFSLSMSSFLALSSCNQSKKNHAQLKSPSIYKAWDARYQYDSDNRQLIPLYNNHQVGRAWGRDQEGRMNYAKYYDGQGKPREDLLAIHKQKLDQERGRRWDELNQMRIKKINEQLLGNEEEVKEAEEEVSTEEDGMDFLPTPFIPTGLDMNMEGGEGESSPFTPMSLEAETESTGPSPFLPLTP